MFNVTSPDHIEEDDDGIKVRFKKTNKFYNMTIDQYWEAMNRKEDYIYVHDSHIISIDRIKMLFTHGEHSVNYKNGDREIILDDDSIIRVPKDQSLIMGRILRDQFCTISTTILRRGVVQAFIIYKKDTYITMVNRVWKLSNFTTYSYIHHRLEYEDMTVYFAKNLKLQEISLIDQNFHFKFDECVLRIFDVKMSTETFNHYIRGLKPWRLSKNANLYLDITMLYLITKRHGYKLPKPIHGIIEYYLAM